MSLATLPAASRRPLDATATLSMVALCAIWGLQQVAVKATEADIAPILQLSIRSGAAALLVVALMRARGERIALGGEDLRPGLAVGGLFALEFLLVGEGLRRTTASHAVMFLYTAPIFAALGLHLRLPSERLRAVQWAGIALALVGIVVAFSGRGGSNAGADAWIGDLLTLGGGVAWGATTVVVRGSRLSEAPAARTLLYQLVGACVLLLGATFVLGRTGFRPTPLAIGGLLFQTVIVSFASFLVWFGLMRRYLASRLGVLSFLTPLFGIVFGVLLLGERLEPSFAVGAGIVFAGILLVSGSEWMRSAFGRRDDAP